MKKKEIWYKDVIALGFKRKIDHDDIYFDQYGYDYFRVEMKLSKKRYLDWDPVTRKVELIKWKPKDGSIFDRRELKTLEEIREVIMTFKPNKLQKEITEKNTEIFEKYG